MPMVYYLLFPETYSDANSRVRRAEETSDLQTDEELGRGHRRVKKKRFEDEDDSAHTDSSADTLVIPSTSQVPKPPTVRRLEVLGGSSLKIAVKSVMDTILTNSLQQKFNWEGKTCWRTKDNFTKKGFKSTKVCQLVFSALLRKP
ncbi:hypothetical protein Pmani_000492 [Petrolisthes manimaculis]|uniref:Uncharacterized protein n=1 Tax=Petrolisthes manimaculis TaxID=1843537 RepID=A0AAE1USP7_9EUCA|nr:hypothetical protein Pmani_000492 [Petrolisthes manimaculis]